MIVRDELRDRPTEMAFAERDHLVQALVLDRAHEAFRVRIRMGARNGVCTTRIPASPNCSRTTAPCPDFGGEEIRPRDRAPMQLQKCMTRCRSLLQRGMLIYCRQRASL